MAGYGNDSENNARSTETTCGGCGADGRAVGIVGESIVTNSSCTWSRRRWMVELDIAVEVTALTGRSVRRPVRRP